MSEFQCHNTLSLLLCLDICLAHSVMSNQFHCCWKFSTEFEGLLYTGANISFSYKEEYFFQNEWDDGDVIGPGIPFSTKANTRKDSSIFFFWIIEVAKVRGIIYMETTFLYKRHILVLHYFDCKNIGDITVKEQITLQNSRYVYRKQLDSSVIFTYFLTACFLKNSHAWKTNSIFWF